MTESIMASIITRRETMSDKINRMLKNEIQVTEERQHGWNAENCGIKNHGTKINT